MESIAYVLVYLATGTLPWIGAEVDNNIKTIEKKSRHMKEKATVAQIC
jgi:hypothetical protein